MEQDMTDWTNEEEEAFNDVENHSNLGKQILKDIGQPYHFEVFVSVSQRNQVLEEVAKEFDRRNNGNGFYEPNEPAEIIRGMKK
jgi:hypothetical protein